MLLTTSQVAERLRVSTKTVRRLVDRHELAVVRPSPRTLRFHPDEIDRYIAATTEQAS